MIVTPFKDHIKYEGIYPHGLIGFAGWLTVKGQVDFLNGPACDKSFKYAKNNREICYKTLAEYEWEDPVC